MGRVAAVDGAVRRWACRHPLREAHSLWSNRVSATVTGKPDHTTTEARRNAKIDNV